MSVNAPDTPPDSDEDAPDLSGPEWLDKFVRTEGPA